MTHLTYLTYMTLMNYSEKKYKPQISPGHSGNTLMTLIAICLIVFVGLAFMKAVWFFRYTKEEAPVYFNMDILSLFVMPASLDSLLSKPWTIITHMFTHDNFWKVFTNMLWLWCFGYILQGTNGTKKIIPVFIYGALSGALAFLLAYNFIPSLQSQLPVANALGASSGVMAIAIVSTLLSPNYRIFPLIGGGIPLWGITIFYFISNLASISFSDTAYLLANLAGAAAGFLFVFFLRRGYDGSKWMNQFFEWVNDLFNPGKPRKGKSIKEELFYKSTSSPFTKTPNLTQQRIDDILDKINLQGYNSLSEEEKELLKRAGKEGL